MVAPIIDPSWHRLPEDQFGPTPSSSTPFDPSSSTTHSVPSSDDEEYDSDWSFEDTEELITLDLGPERVARRALLGYSVGLDYTEAESGTVASGSARSIRGFRGAEAEKRSKRAPTSGDSATRTASSQSRGARQHMGVGKMLSITGLNTTTPLIKIDDTVLRGRRMVLFGTEIILADDFDPTRPPGSQHRLRPIPPSTREGRADTQSSTTRNRILFRPIYDPKQRENAQENDANLAALRKLVKPSSHHINLDAAGRDEEEDDIPLASLVNLTATSDAPQKGVGRGKYKRKEVSEEEQIIRAAERKIRKAAKAHLRQQEEEAAAAAAAAAAAHVQAPQEQGQELGQEQFQGVNSEQQAQEEPMEQIREPQPPPSFSQQ